MPKRKLTNKLDLLHPMSKDFKDLLEKTDILRRQFLRKNDTLLMPKMLGDELHYLPIGLCKAYWLNEDNKEEIFYFWANGDVIFLDIFFTGLKNTDIFLVMLEDSELYTLTKDQMDEICEKYPEAYKILNLLRAEVAEMRDKHTRLLLRKEGMRYAIFLQEFPQLKNRLSAKDICRFLGICEKTLKRSKTDLILKDRNRKVRTVIR